MSERGQWSSRIGFVLAAAGSAIGLGAIWKFPYMAGMNGGGAFLLVYLAAVLGVGISMMLAELAMGRAVQRDAITSFAALGGPVGVFFGWLSLLAAFLILAFYCVIGGWTVGYLGLALSGGLFDPVDSAGFARHHQEFIADPVASLLLFAVFLALTALILAGGIKSGIERVSKVLMPILFGLLLLMIIRSVTLPGAMEGVLFLLRPDIGGITPKVLIDALGFACFSLSLGFGAMLTYGSYVRKEENMAKSALWVVCLQSICAVLAGLMIMPAVFAFGMQPTEGPGLTYITLPAVFKAMPGGQLFAILFFLLLLIAALTSSISLLEPLVARLIDRHGFSRAKAAIVVLLVLFIPGIPAAWSFGGADLPRIFGQSPFGFMDSITSNLMLPLNAMAACLIMGWRNLPLFLQELYLREPKQGVYPGWVRSVVACCRFLAPGVIVVILGANLLF